MVPVIAVLVLSQPRKPLCFVLRVIVRLNIPLEAGVVGPGAVPEDSPGRELAGALVAGALLHETVQDLSPTGDAPLSPHSP